jgi:hypothetical protein
MGRLSKFAWRDLASEFDADPAAIRSDLDPSIKELAPHGLILVAASERRARVRAGTQSDRNDSSGYAQGPAVILLPRQKP